MSFSKSLMTGVAAVATVSALSFAFAQTTQADGTTPETVMSPATAPNPPARELPGMLDGQALVDAQQAQQPLPQQQPAVMTPPADTPPVTDSSMQAPADTAVAPVPDSSSNDQSFQGERSAQADRN